MPIRAGERERSAAGAAKGAIGHATRIARLELELAFLELKRKLPRVGVGVAMLAGAALVAVFVAALLVAAVAAGIATALPVWASLLLTAVPLLALAAWLVVLALRSIRHGLPPAPVQAIEEARRTVHVLGANGDPGTR